MGIEEIVNPKIPEQKSSKKIFISFTVVLLFLLTFLCIRENERANAAEAKAKDLQDKMESLRNEKNDVTAELQNEVDELNAKLNDANVRADALTVQKNDEIDKLTAQMQRESADHETALKEKTEEANTLESRSKAEADKFSAQLKEKNEEITDLGAKLQDVSTKLASVLKKKEALESQIAGTEAKIAELQRDLKKMEQHNAKLVKTIQNAQERPAAALD
jgi:chromosome segregation ATPase